MKEPKIDTNLQAQLMRVLRRESQIETVYTDNSRKAYHQIRNWLLYCEGEVPLEVASWAKTKRTMQPNCLIIQAIEQITVTEVTPEKTLIKRIQARKPKKIYESEIERWENNIEGLFTNSGYLAGTPEQQRDIREQWDTILNSYIYAQESWVYDAVPDLSYLDIGNPPIPERVIEAFLTGEKRDDDEA